MTTRLKDGTTKSSRIVALESAYRKHQAAIQDALDRRAQAMRGNLPVIVASAPDGRRFEIACSGGAYRVLGVEQGRQAS